MESWAKITKGLSQSNSEMHSQKASEVEKQNIRDDTKFYIFSVRPCPPQIERAEEPRTKMVKMREIAREMLKSVCVDQGRVQSPHIAAGRVDAENQNAAETPMTQFVYVEGPRTNECQGR